jgi:hypothetical protein
MTGSCTLLLDPHFGNTDFDRPTLPILTYLLFRNRAKTAMPKVRDWMYANSWLVNVIGIGIFIGLVLG